MLGLLTLATTLVVDPVEPYVDIRFTSHTCVLTNEGVVFSGHVDRLRTQRHVDVHGLDPVTFDVVVRTPDYSVGGGATSQMRFESTPDGPAPVSVWVLTDAPKRNDLSCYAKIPYVQ